MKNEGQAMTAIRWFPHSLLSFPCTEILEDLEGLV
jgi:hypothetical protein